MPSICFVRKTKKLKSHNYSLIDSKNSVVYSTIACNITTITFQIIALPWSLRRVLWCCSGRTKKTWLSEVVVRGKTSFNDTAVTKTCKQRSTLKRFVFKPDGHKRVFCQLDLQPAFAHLLSQPNWANKSSLCSFSHHFFVFTSNLSVDNSKRKHNLTICRLYFNASVAHLSGRNPVSSIEGCFDRQL